MTLSENADLAPTAPTTEREGRPALYDDWARRMLGSGANVTESAVQAATARARARVMTLADPFLPIAQNVPGAREGRHVVFEDEAFVVLRDRFGAPLKLLVVPRRAACFPSDLAEPERAAFERLTGRVRDALNDVVGGAQPLCWVNPPSALSVRHLHAHIQPAGDSPEPAAALEQVSAILYRGREIELKFGFASGGDADRAKAAFPLSAPLQSRQVNHFFDTAEFALSDARFVCRVRRADENVVLTLKGPATGAGLVSTKREEEWMLDARARDAFDRGQFAPLAFAASHPHGAEPSELVQAQLAAAAGTPIVDVGAFENVRTVHAVTLRDESGSLELCFEFDRTRFPGADPAFELEIECATPRAATRVETWVSARLDEAGVRPEVRPGKARRFFTAIRGAKK